MYKYDKTRMVLTWNFLLIFIIVIRLGLNILPTRQLFIIIVSLYSCVW